MVLFFLLLFLFFVFVSEGCVFWVTEVAMTAGSAILDASSPSNITPVAKANRVVFGFENFM